jgi:lipoprotein NlpD
VRVSRRFLAIGFCCLLLGACADTAATRPESYVVRQGDTLYSIAWRHDLDYRDLARWNDLGSDFRITVGEVLALRPGVGPRPPRAQPRAANAAVKWVWPTDRVGVPKPVAGGGILLSGRLRQDVRAASAGRVVYTGSGLRAYGNLVIIKHADNLLSAYAHNSELLVHDGDEVVMGQAIARMGEDAHQSPVLYFEIRQNGKPIDPLPLLPK